MFILDLAITEGNCNKNDCALTACKASSRVLYIIQVSTIPFNEVGLFRTLVLGTKILNNTETIMPKGQVIINWGWLQNRKGGSQVLPLRRGVGVTILVIQKGGCKG